MNGLDDLLAIAPRQIGAADASGEEGIAGNHHFEWSEMEADGALGVTRRVNYLGWIRGESDDLSVDHGFIGRSCFWRRRSEPSRLDVHHLEQREIILIQQNGCAGEALELEGATDVIDVRVGDENLLQREALGLKPAVDSRDLISGVDDDRFAGGFVAQQSAVALEGANGKGLKDHAAILKRPGEARAW